MVLGGLDKGLVLAGAPARLHDVLVEDDDGARHDAGGEVVEDGLGRGVEIAVDVDKARGGRRW